MTNNIKLVLKGFAIGLGKVIPGVSGAVLAITLNVYESALDAISCLKKDFYNNIKYLAILGIGMVFAIVFGSKVIIYCLEHYYLATIFLFLGMMICGTVPVFKETKGSKKSNWFFSIFLVLFFLTLLLFNPNSPFKNNNSLFILIISYFISGILDSASSIIPGISGTAILMMVGTYSSILKGLGSLLNFSNIGDNLIILVPFFSGFLIGGYYISKIINHLFKKYRKGTYCCITGFSILSMIMLMCSTFQKTYDIKEFLLGIICFIVGFFVTKKMNK